MNKKVKIAIPIVLAIISIMTFGLGISYFLEKQRDEKALSFFADEPWEWDDKYNGTQIKYSGTLKRHALRKVKERENQVIYAHKKDDYSLVVRVDFITECTPETNIPTSSKYSTGETKILHCDKSGSYLSYSTAIQTPENDIVIHENLDGFSIYENFFYWDLNKLDKEVTLSKAN
ncbi:hypothetical protein [Pseudomonas sp. PL-6]